MGAAIAAAVSSPWFWLLLGGLPITILLVIPAIIARGKDHGLKELQWKIPLLGELRLTYRDPDDPPHGDEIRGEVRDQHLPALWRRIRALLGRRDSR
ncbi:hypothetical protein [Bailinhaonella thermotolerans]|uniref:Uncharacterized protein n=1 Tax=Bailinhaonella thermotolerans TaxID=1070861 RepID=A0A3A4A0X8_9ACTN|nr:hypothetical protein [Bailinhaonella thermotolerans]RJL22039.1 hypothetical protein D5H75_36160 [Bailinhaonella thermotolerans]